MGGGGGINPIAVIGSMVFGQALSAVTGMATADSRASQAAETSAVADESAALARRKADRQKAEAALLTKARQAERADLASQDTRAESLGAPSVAATQLKERLGQ